MHRILIVESGGQLQEGEQGGGGLAGDSGFHLTFEYACDGRLIRLAVGYTAHFVARQVHELGHTVFDHVSDVHCRPRTSPFNAQCIRFRHEAAFEQVEGAASGWKVLLVVSHVRQYVIDHPRPL